MALIKPLHDLTLDEINDELDLLGNKKKYSSVRHARNAVRKLVDQKKCKYEGEVPFIDEDALKLLEESEKPKAKKKETKKIERIWVDEAEHSMIGTEVFSKAGKHTITKVGFYEDDPDTTMVILSDDKDSIVKLSSVRTTAVNADYRNKYDTFKEQKTAGGKPSIGVNDGITHALFGKGVEELAEIAEENGIDFSRWNHLNPGMKRMCLGNTLRGKMNKGNRITVGGQVLVPGTEDEAEDQIEDSDGDDFEDEFEQQAATA